jgi:alpha-ketoglutarate-dependent taurine dioxygenase
MNTPAPHFDLNETRAYAEWRARKLARYPRSVDELVVRIRDPDRLCAVEREALLSRCARANMAVYSAPPLHVVQPGPAKETARRLGAQLGLVTLDVNYLADDDGITPLSCVEGGVRGDFIPYTNRAIRWHTDGYYNPPERLVRAMVLHCVQRAAHGGENRLLDHELAYLLLRDADPAFVRALMAPDAMTIPARNEDGAEARAEEAGPVFSVDRAGNLHMRYTARTRSIVWKDDDATRAAVGALEELLASNAHVLSVRLEAGMGLVCNNVLHDRSAFTDAGERRRLLLRARYYERIGGVAQPNDPARTARATDVAADMHG